MRIGIMTFWESKNNYGQILQLYALQQYLISLGYDPFLIRFRRINPPDNRTFFQKIFSVNWSDVIKYRLERSKRERSKMLDERREFEKFKRDNIIFGEKIYSSLEELMKDPPIAEAYVVGSDQVWNNNFKVSAEPFLLGFGEKNVKKIAYAASFGQKELDERTAQMFSKHLNNFDAVSVREKSGVELCNLLGYKNASWVPDPTLLFDATSWEQKLGLVEKNEEGHVFIYTLGNSKISNRTKFIEFAKKENKGNVIHATANHDFSGNSYPTIPEWVDAIRRAKLVITTSFHGMVFSIIFNRRFVILPNTDHAVGMNERIYSLLTKLNLEEHIMEKYNENVLLDLLNKEIDWDNINSIIKDWKDSANSFLEDNLRLNGG